MKKILFTVLISIITFYSGIAQQKRPAPTRPAWVIESNVMAPKLQTVKFYNARQQLIYEETVKGKKIDIRKPATQKKLNDLLAKLVEQDRQNRRDERTTAALPR